VPLKDRNISRVSQKEERQSGDERQTRYAHAREGRADNRENDRGGREQAAKRYPQQNTLLKKNHLMQSP
jgi:hypothetical protein